MTFYHGTARKFRIGEALVPPKEHGFEISEKGRKKNLDKVFFTSDVGSAKIYARRAVKSYGGIPHIYEVEVPNVDIEVINPTPGTTVFAAPMATIVGEVEFEKPMEDIFEDWRKFLLSEKLMLKPGAGGWDQYAQLVGEAYLSAPSFEERAVSSFQALTPFVENMFKQIQSRVNIEFVNYHPYANAKELQAEVEATGKMKVATIDSEHAIFDELTNAKFRAIHDYMSHIQAIGSRGTDFTLTGEIKAYNVHLKTLPKQAIPALFTEVLGQVCAYYVLGRFAEQKICLLDGFDYENVGVVEGYDIVDKELVKK